MDGTVKQKVHDVELDLKSLFPENMQAMINAMPASIRPAKKKTADNSKSLVIKLAKKQ